MRKCIRSRRSACAVFVAVAFLPFGIRAAETATSTTAPFAERIALFDYDRSADLHVTSAGAERRGDVNVRDITFAADPREPAKTTRAFLVVPDGAGPHAGVLWIHWLGEPKTTNRTEFLEEAVALAPRGVVSLLVDAMWSAPNWYRSRVLDEDYANSVRQVIALRRAMDLLLAQSSVDRARVGVVAHDYGAMYGAVAFGVDSRVRACVFVAATASLNDWAFYVQKPASMDDYLRQNKPLELTDYLREVKGATILMQYAEHDFYVPLAKATEFFAAAPEPKQMSIYGGAKHEMTAPATIRLDRDAFLARELGLK